VRSAQRRSRELSYEGEGASDEPGPPISETRALKTRADERAPCDREWAGEEARAMCGCQWAPDVRVPARAGRSRDLGRAGHLVWGELLVCSPVAMFPFFFLDFIFCFLLSLILLNPNLNSNLFGNLNPF
jgi:hypothetical protein